VISSPNPKHKKPDVRGNKHRVNCLAVEPVLAIDGVIAYLGGANEQDSEESIPKVTSIHNQSKPLPCLTKSPQLSAPLVLRHQFKIAVKYTSIKPTFRGRDKQRIGNMMGQVLTTWAWMLKWFADYWLDSVRRISVLSGVFQQPSICDLWGTE
jgi:hypothetical protein